MQFRDCERTILVDHFDYWIVAAVGRSHGTFTLTQCYVTSLGLWYIQFLRRTALEMNL